MIFCPNDKFDRKSLSVLLLACEILFSKKLLFTLAPPPKSVATIFQQSALTRELFVLILMGISTKNESENTTQTICSLYVAMVLFYCKDCVSWMHEHM